MLPPQAEQKLLSGFHLPSQHRRRISLPTSPPETPLDGYFPPSANTTPRVPHPQSIYPASPPASPVRATAADEKARLAAQSQQGRAAPMSGHRRPVSQAYSHHRRTSTATIIRLAVAGRAPSAGMVLTPSKAVTLFLIVLSATYLALFLPRPAGLRPSQRAPPHPQHFQKPPSFTVPKYVRHAAPAPAAGMIGDAVERMAWAERLSHRVPPQERPVGSEAGAPHPTSQDGELWRLHPELLSSGARPVRRRPLRLQPLGTGISTEVDGDERMVREVDIDDESFDVPQPASQVRGETAAEKMHAAARSERNAQLARMKKVSVAQRREARVGRHVPIDSSAQMEAARAERERVIVAAGSGAGKKKLRRKSQGVVEMEHEAEAQRERARIARTSHVRATAKQEEQSTMADPEES